MDRKELNLDGLPVRYYEAGEGPVLLLLHGAGGTARLWHRQMGPLSARFRVLAPDLPGFGGTGLPHWIKRVRDYAAFAARFLRALDVGRATLAGSSMGGWAACWFALDYAGMLDGLVLISPAGLYFKEEPPMPVPVLIKELRRYYFPAGPAGQVNSNAEADFRRAMDTLSAIDGKDGYGPDLSGRLEGIKAKTTIIWGTEDRVIPVSYAAAFNQAIHGSVLRLVNGAGHLPFVENAEDVNEIIININT